MEWSDANTLHRIKSYENVSYLYNLYAACNWTVAAYATLSRDFVAHSRDKIARENYRCNIGLSVLCVMLQNNLNFELHIDSSLKQCSQKVSH